MDKQYLGEEKLKEIEKWVSKKTGVPLDRLKLIHWRCETVCTGYTDDGWLKFERTGRRFFFFKDTKYDTDGDFSYMIEETSEGQLKLI